MEQPGCVAPLDPHTHTCTLSLTDHIFSTHRGEISQPCCMKAPSENQRELKMPNSFGGWSLGPCSVVPSSGSSACHSYGLKRLTCDDTRKQYLSYQCRAKISNVSVYIVTPRQSSMTSPTPNTHQKQHHADSDVRKHDAHPNFIGQRVQERENTWFGLLRLLNHDGDSQRHERL